MAATSCTDAGAASAKLGLDRAEQKLLLEIARESVQRGLRGEAWSPGPAGISAVMREPAACFVTLRSGARLRGCVGVLVARNPLADEVARSARGAAFHDPRFASVCAGELALIHFHISVLGSPEPVACTSERDLIARLRPGFDGVTLRDGHSVGTFLPEVWAQFPDPGEFVRQLRIKAGLPTNRWSSTMTAERYATQSFGE